MMNIQKIFQLRNLGLRFRFTLLLYFLTFFSMGVVGYYGYTTAADAYLENAKDSVGDTLTSVTDKINEFNNLIHKDLQFFSNNFSLIQQQYWLDMQDQRKHHHWKGITEDMWFDFVQNYDHFFKVRFIGLHGKEEIVIRRDPKTREVRVLREDRYQDRKTDDYFTQGVSLARDHINVGPIDLNREYGQIEKPLVPVFRLSQSVFGENKVRYGVVVLNIFADTIFNYIRNFEKKIANRQFYLINKKGEFLYHKDPAKTFSLLLGHDFSFESLYPKTLATLNDNTSGAIFIKDHVLGFKRIYPDINNKDSYLILISTVSESEVLSGLTNFKIAFFSLVLIMVVLVFISSHFYIDGLMKPLLFVTRQLQMLGKGQVKSEKIVYHNNDEIRQMLDSTEQVTRSMLTLTLQADSIAQGNFNSKVKLLSNEDGLGNAINNMTQILRQNQLFTLQQNWHKDGINKLSEELSGDHPSKILAEKALSFVANYLEMGRGVFYVYNTHQKSLDLLGAYMLSQYKAPVSSFMLGEGSIGQTALELKPIFLKVYEHNKTAPILTGTSTTTPFYVYTHPLINEEELLGVLEVSGFNELEEARMDFLVNATQVITSFLFMSLQRERIAKLLIQTEEAARQSENQREELQETNAKMEEQQSQLQQQTEELREANAQMEEHRQQLELQSNELQQKNEALEKTQDEVNARAKQLEEANQYKSDFLANMSHELRTPLNSINVISKMMLRNEDNKFDEDTVKKSEVIFNSGNELLRLINDVLDLSKIEAGRVDLHQEDIHTAEIADEMNVMFKETSHEKKIEYLVEDEFKDHIVSDRQKLVQIIRNLLSNAFKFTSKGRIKLQFSESQNPQYTLQITVTDTGIGIPKDQLEKIFEAFRQVDSSISRIYGGTGLGLSISKEFAQLLGASLTVESAPNKGSTFTLLVPSMSPSKTKAPPILPQKETKVAKGESILIIDDDKNFITNITFLNEKKGLVTLAAQTGKEGIELARNHLPAGIILDLGLPDMRGEKVLESLKTDINLKDIPIYIISAQDRDLSLIEQGALGFLQKPVTDSQIQKAEQTLLQFISKEHKNLLVVEGPDLKPSIISPFLGSNTKLTSLNCGLETLEKLSHNLYDILFVDYQMKNIDCLDFCKKAAARQPDLPIVIYCNENLNEERHSKLSLYSESIIQKCPQDSRRISKEIERFLTQSLEKQERISKPPNISASKKLKGKRILVADDDLRNLYVLTSSLEQNGATVDNAINGKKALDLLNKEKCDLVIMDIMMPEMDGYSAIKAIRSNPILSDITIIALTAKALKEDRQNCLKAGADDYLSKPVDYDMLINMVQAWIKKG